LFSFTYDIINMHVFLYIMFSLYNCKEIYFYVIHIQYDLFC